jgi:hypothetical protein
VEILLAKNSNGNSRHQTAMEKMKRSTARILTTFVGSLARPAGLIETLKAKENGQSCDRQ